MKKIELKSFTEYFGNFLPAGKIQNRETRLAIVLLYGSLCKANKDVAEEIEAVRKKIVGDKEADVLKYASLLQKANDKTVDEKERDAAKEEAYKMTECVQIEKDFSDAASKILDENVEVSVKKVSLELLYDALSDCGFPAFGEDCPISVIEQNFAQVIK